MRVPRRIREAAIRGTEEAAGAEPRTTAASSVESRDIFRTLVPMMMSEEEEHRREDVAVAVAEVRERGVLEGSEGVEVEIGRYRSRREVYCCDLPMLMYLTAQRQSVSRARRAPILRRTNAGMLACLSPSSHSSIGRQRTTLHSLPFGVSVQYSKRLDEVEAVSRKRQTGFRAME